MLVHVVLHRGDIVERCSVPGLAPAHGYSRWCSYRHLLSPWRMYPDQVHPLSNTNGAGGGPGPGVDVAVQHPQPRRRHPRRRRRPGGGGDGEHADGGGGVRRLAVAPRSVAHARACATVSASVSCAHASRSVTHTRMRHGQSPRLSRQTHVAQTRDADAQSCRVAQLRHGQSRTPIYAHTYARACTRTHTCTRLQPEPDE
jgi:hypothetical protein